MMRPFPSALVITFAACAGMHSAAPSLAGNWTPVTAQLGGKDYAIANFDGATLRLTAIGYEFGPDRGTYTVVLTPSPAQMDIHGGDGPNAGRTILAIDELAGDQLTVCYQLARGGERPIAFVSPPNTMVLLVHYRRQP